MRTGCVVVMNKYERINIRRSERKREKGRERKYERGKRKRV